MVTVLGGLAEFERDLIRARTGEGERQEPWATVQDDSTPEEGGACAARERGAIDGDRPQLQRQRGDDFEAQRMIQIPFLEPPPRPTLNRSEPNRLHLPKLADITGKYDI